MRMLELSRDHGRHRLETRKSPAVDKGELTGSRTTELDALLKALHPRVCNVVGRLIGRGEDAGVHGCIVVGGGVGARGVWNRRGSSLGRIPETVHNLSSARLSLSRDLACRPRMGGGRSAQGEQSKERQEGQHGSHPGHVWQNE